MENNEVKFIKHINSEKLKEAVEQVYALHMAFMDAGFTEKQSIDLICAQMQQPTYDAQQQFEEFE